MNQEKIGRFIVEIRTSKKMTQKELADKLNVTPTEPLVIGKTEEDYQTIASYKIYAMNLELP